MTKKTPPIFRAKAVQQPDGSIKWVAPTDGDAQFYGKSIADMIMQQQAQQNTGIGRFADKGHLDCLDKLNKAASMGPLDTNITWYINTLYLAGIIEYIAMLESTVMTLNQMLNAEYQVARDERNNKSTVLSMAEQDGCVNEVLLLDERHAYFDRSKTTMERKK